MESFEDFLAGIEDRDHRERIAEVLAWVGEAFPTLEPVIKWNQPMFTDHGTFIIGFSVAKKHMAVGAEVAGVAHFSDGIVEAGYDHTSQLVRIRWDQPVDYALLERMIAFNMAEKADCSTFWRKKR